VDRDFQAALRRSLSGLGLALGAGAEERLARYAERLLAWNRKVNLTAVTDPAELAEKHLADSLALLPEVAGARALLDVGSGAGLPGIPLAIACPELSVTCCDSASKKVAFVKAVAAELELRVRGVAVRAAGDPEREGLPRADRVVSRALADPDRWLPLGRNYLASGGVLLAMLGRGAEEGELRRSGEAAGLRLVGVRRFALPLSGAQRAVASYRA